MPQIQKGTTYTAGAPGNVVDYINLNAHVDNAVLLPGAITDQPGKSAPAAADTVLVHSAADVALRKTTVQELFATPQPIGATTRSSGAFTTLTANGAFSLTGDTVQPSEGGTGLSGTPSNGQLPIGNGSGYTLANLTAGSNITITNGAGSITIAAAGGGGGSVTSVNASGGSTGLSFSGGPVTTSGTLTLAGTLAVANGGTGATDAGNARTNLGLGSIATSNVTVSTSSPSGGVDGDIWLKY